MSAVVGDDVYGEDPTVNLLEKRAAEMCGHQAALFVPTGTMGNVIGIRLHTQHGQEVICESRSHVLDWEMGMIAAFAGCQVRTVTAERGMLTWNHIVEVIAPQIYYRAQTGLVCVENTHNMAGGTVTPVSVLEEIWDGAKSAGLPVHLDGARVFNAAAALGVPVADIVRGFDTAMFSLSKGLGAPVGSVLVGSRELIARARSIRKALGGGMRQAGVLAAAGLVALEDGPQRLGEDHANAKLLADAIAGSAKAEIDIEAVETNIVIFRLIASDAAGFVRRLKDSDVLASAIGPHSVRLVTHLDVDRVACMKAAETISQELARI